MNLEAVLDQELDKAEPDLEAIGRAWLWEHAAGLLEAARRRRERQRLVDEAQAALNEALAQEREANRAMREAIERHEAVLQQRQRLWNQRLQPVDAVAHRRQLGELDAAEAQWRAEREIRASAHARAVAAVARARRQVEMLRAGEAESALR